MPSSTVVFSVNELGLCAVRIYSGNKVPEIDEKLKEVCFYSSEDDNIQEVLKGLTMLKENLDKFTCIGMH